MTRWVALAVAGAVALVIGVFTNPAQAYFSYLTAYAFALGIALGALFLILIEQLISSTWFVVVRRAAESIASSLPLLLVLFVPIPLGARWLFPWTHVASLESQTRSLVAQKTAYLNLPFFIARAAVYFACWIAIAEEVRRWSLRQDQDRSAEWSQRIRTLSAPALIVLAFTMGFAAIDWLMSLSPVFSSTIFGVQLFAGAMLGALALIAWLLGHPADSPLAAASTEDHRAAMGKMIFTFAIFWAYTTFVQLLIVWIADLPAEIAWYSARIAGTWRAFGLLVAAGQFGVPFALMLSHSLKRSRRVLAGLGMWLLVVHYLELYWIVMPQLHPGGIGPHWLDAGAAAAVVGVTVAFTMWRARGHEAIPVGDPELLTSLRYSES